MSASGRFVALRRPGAVEVVDVQGTAPRRSFALAEGGDFAIAGGWLCLSEDKLRIERLDGVRSGTLAGVAGTLRAFAGRTADAVIAGGTLVVLEPEPVASTVAPEKTTWFPLVGRSVLAVTAGRAAVVCAGKPAPAGIPVGGDVIGVSSLFAGRSIAVLVATKEGHQVLVMNAAGQIAHRIHVPAATWHAFAPAKGQLLLGSGGDDVVAVDLRFGKLCGQGAAPHVVTALVTDEEGRSCAIASPTESGVPMVSVVRLDELVKTGSSEGLPPAPAPDVEPEPEPEPELVPQSAPAVVENHREDLDLPDVLPLALGLPAAPVDVPPTDAEPFANAREHLAALMELVTRRAATAIAEAWHSGRISADGNDQLPFEHEVYGLVGESSGLAPDRLAAAHDKLRERSEIVGARSLATLRAGIELPFVAVAQELALSAVATQVLLAVLAPQVRPEIARLYRIVGNETARATCDDALVCQLLAGAHGELRDAILDELAPDAPLLRSGAVHRAGAGLEVDAALLARLRGRAIPVSAATKRRSAVRTLRELTIDRHVLRRLASELATPGPRPARVVIRGKLGAGRHSVIAALAACIGLDIACIDAAQLPRSTLADSLARELAQAHLTRAVPVISGLELGSGAELDGTQRIRQILAAHRGPIVIRTGVDAQLPLDPGFLDITLPALTETERQRCFASALAEVGITADCSLLAHRYRVGPGTMHRIARAARERLARQPAANMTSIVDEVARQHVAARIGSAAQRVTRLADWDHVALPDDMLDSLRELIGRARHARTVYEDWGYDARITTARGLTALFYGPPGTGKTMVAGLVARELGLELYRVDLSKVMSKWVGETEKNLGEVFDAAEDGQLMLLFDEADSLFAKRSEVKSSNDRYANLEVNYLLQRLDSFEGVAILTTNLEGSIDPAFKRRLSMRLYFPFPDEDMRARLWETHVMPRMPTAGKLDFAALARRFPLSGGYIRNSALRAAFLAAQEQTQLTQAHLERAVLLEYRELGKLAQDGRME